MRDHAHPTDFRLVRHFDRGWGEIAFEYGWDSTTCSLTDLSDCFLYEITSYADNNGSYMDGWYVPPDPPFRDWRFRHPTDGRTGPVGMECFSGNQGWAWDRHKIAGRLVIPPQPRPWSIRAIQEYRFHCEQCGADEALYGPHEISRTFAPLTHGWRYSIAKHGVTAWMDLSTEGSYVDDSAHIGFAPWEP